MDQIDLHLSDDNIQNRNAANAGDGPKHIAWLHMLDLKKARLRTVVETHAGGGIYKVEKDRFCVGLPEDSVLGRHQTNSQLPPASSGMAYYSASGDQALKQMPSGCRYVAYDKNRTTADRLKAAAAWRGRSADLDSRNGSYAGNGDLATGVPANLRPLDPETTLVMVDPFEVKDLSKAVRCVMPQRNGRTVFFPTVVFGVRSHFEGRGTREFDEAWARALAAFEPVARVEWRWCGTTRPSDRITHDYYLLVATPDSDTARTVVERLSGEHALLLRERGQSHQYVAPIPPRLLLLP